MRAGPRKQTSPTTPDGVAAPVSSSRAVTTPATGQPTWPATSSMSGEVAVAMYEPASVWLASHGEAGAGLDFPGRLYRLTREPSKSFPNRTVFLFRLVEPIARLS